MTIKRRRKAGLPDLYDNNDLPDPAYDANYIHVLTEEEQADLHYRMCHRILDVYQLKLIERIFTRTT